MGALIAQPVFYAMSSNIKAKFGPLAMLPMTNGAYMARCGIDAFEVNQDVTLEQFNTAMAELSDAYQPAADTQNAIPWRRQGRLRPNKAVSISVVFCANLSASRADPCENVQPSEPCPVLSHTSSSGAQSIIGAPSASLAADLTKLNLVQIVPHQETGSACARAMDLMRAG